MANTGQVNTSSMKPWPVETLGKGLNWQTLPSWFRQLELQLTQTLNVPEITKTQTDRKP